MNTKSIYLLAITVFIIPSAMASCNETMNTSELTNCVFLESKGISYNKWKENFSNPPAEKNDGQDKDMALIINTPLFRN